MQARGAFNPADVEKPWLRVDFEVSFLKRQASDGAGRNFGFDRGMHPIRVEPIAIAASTMNVPGETVE